MSRRTEVRRRVPSEQRIRAAASEGIISRRSDLCEVISRGPATGKGYTRRDTEFARLRPISIRTNTDVDSLESVPRGAHSRAPMFYVYTGLGDKTLAVEWLERAVATRLTIFAPVRVAGKLVERPARVLAYEWLRVIERPCQRIYVARFAVIREHDGRIPFQTAELGALQR